VRENGIFHGQEIGRAKKKPFYFPRQKKKKTSLVDRLTSGGEDKTKLQTALKKKIDGTLGL